LAHDQIFWPTGRSRDCSPSLSEVAVSSFRREGRTGRFFPLNFFFFSEHADVGTFFPSPYAISEIEACCILLFFRLPFRFALFSFFLEVLGSFRPDFSRSSPPQDSHAAAFSSFAEQDRRLSPLSRRGDPPKALFFFRSRLFPLFSTRRFELSNGPSPLYLDPVEPLSCSPFFAARARLLSRLQESVPS